MKVKYIKTNKNQIIVFSELQLHSEFKIYEPISAGFIKIMKTTKNEPRCFCYGESISLNLKSDKKIDNELANVQILGHQRFLKINSQ